MRVSRKQAELNRQTVIETGSRLFRERGFDGIGLKDLMKEAGFTQGGFYKQFDSKNNLIAETSRRAIEMSCQDWKEAITGHPGHELDAILAFYLSLEHRAAPGVGCPLAALGSDAARQSPEVKASFEAGIKNILQMVEGFMPSEGDRTPASRAFGILSLLVGAMTLARLVEDEQLAANFLDMAGNEVRQISRAEPTH